MIGVGAVAPGMAPPPPGPAAWPVAPPEGPAGLRNPRYEDGPDDGLVTAGATLFALGWASGITWGAIDLAATTGRSVTTTTPTYSYTQVTDTSCSDQVGGWMFLPIVGPVVSIVAAFDCTTHDYQVDQSNGTITPTPRRYDGQFYATLGFSLTELFEVLGLALLLPGLLGHGNHLHVDDRATLDLGDGARLSFAASAPGADVGGLSLRLEL